MSANKSTTTGTEVQVPVAHQEGASPFDQIRHVDENGVEFWLARELMSELGYSDWRNFELVVEKAKMAFEAAGLDPTSWIVAVNKPISSGRGRVQEIDDIRLTRRACYMVAICGDPRKPQVAAAKNYFVVKTREAELRPTIDLTPIVQAVAKAVEALARTIEANTKAITMYAADQALTNGRVAEMDYRLGIVEKRTDTPVERKSPPRRDPLDEPWMTVYEYCNPRGLPRDIETLKIQSSKLRAICRRRGVESMRRYVTEVKGYRKIYPKSLFDEFYSDPVNQRFRHRGDENLPLFDRERNGSDRQTVR